MAQPDLSLIVMVEPKTGESFVSLRAVAELEEAVEVSEANLNEIKDCLAKIKSERARLEEKWRAENPQG